MTPKAFGITWAVTALVFLAFAELHSITDVFFVVLAAVSAPIGALFAADERT